MRLSTSFVAVKKITSSTDISEFDSEGIEQLAQQILKAEGVISPLVLRRTSLESYDVIDGHFAYHAAVKAREINGRKGETIAAYIIEPDDIASDAILQQIELIRRSQSLETHEKTTEITIAPSANPPDPSLSSSLINAIESSITKQLTSVNSNLKNIEAKLERASSTTSSTIADSDQLGVLAKAIADLDRRIPQLPAPRPESQLLDDLNHQSHAELTEKFAKAGFKAANLQKLVNSIIATRPYTSFADLTSRKSTTGKKDRFFTEITLVKVLDTY